MTEVASKWPDVGCPRPSRPSRGPPPSAPCQRFRAAFHCSLSARWQGPPSRQVVRVRCQRKETFGHAVGGERIIAAVTGTAKSARSVAVRGRETIDALCSRRRSTRGLAVRDTVTIGALRTTACEAARCVDALGLRHARVRVQCTFVYVRAGLLASRVGVAVMAHAFEGAFRVYARGTPCPADSRLAPLTVALHCRHMRFALIDIVAHEAIPFKPR